MVVFAATDTCLVKSSKLVNSYLILPVPVRTNSGLCSLNSNFKSCRGGKNYEHERKKSNRIWPTKVASLDCVVHALQIIHPVASLFLSHAYQQLHMLGLVKLIYEFLLHLLPCQSASQSFYGLVYI